MTKDSHCITGREMLETMSQEGVSLFKRKARIMEQVENKF